MGQATSMKVWLTVCLAVSASAVLAQGHTRIQLPNTGFEDGVDDSGLAVKWNTHPATPIGKVTEERSHSGKTALKFVDESNTQSYAIQSDLYPAIPGETYRATSWVYNESGSGWLYLEFYEDSVNRLTEQIVRVTTSGVWTQAVAEVVCPPQAKYVSCLFYSSLGNVGVSYFDDVSLEGPQAPGKVIRLGEEVPVDYSFIYEVGSEKQLLMDEAFFEKKENISLKVHPPVKTGEKNVISDKPWESFVINWHSFMEDVAEDGSKVYRLWYEAYDSSYHGDLEARYCYAESKDGVHWTKPNLGLVEFNGSRQNNILFGNLGGKGVHGGSVFKDPVAPPTERYKFIFLSSAGVDGAYSADGIHWTPYSKSPILAVGSDTQQVCFWDARLKKYVAFCRLWTAGRTVGRSESEDFQHFPPAKEVLRADAKDPADTDLYNSAAIHYPYAANAYFIFTSVYQHKPDTLHVELATSRDGVHWQRPERVPFIPLGKPGEWDCGHVYAGAGLLRIGDSLSMYYQGYSHTHNQQIPSGVHAEGVYSRCTLRLDGYVSADAPAQGGWFVTPVLTISGRRLEINAETRGKGQLLIELQDENGKPIPGYSLQDCRPVRGDSVRQVVTWKGHKDMKALKTNRVRMKVEMKDASLYAFQFAR